VKLTCSCLAESGRTHDGVEYLTATLLETGPTPLLQLMDYGLREEEKHHKGKLQGKTIELQVETIRALFSGRPQLAGRIVAVK